MIAQLAILTGLVLVAWAVGIALVRNASTDLGRWAGDVLVIWAPAGVAMVAIAESNLGPTVDAWLLGIGFALTTGLAFTSKLWGREFNQHHETPEVHDDR